MTRPERARHRWRRRSCRRQLRCQPMARTIATPRMTSSWISVPSGRAWICPGSPRPPRLERSRSSPKSSRSGQDGAEGRTTQAVLALTGDVIATQTRTFQVGPASAAFPMRSGVRGDSHGGSPPPRRGIHGFADPRRPFAGQEFRPGRSPSPRNELVAFAREYDPQPSISMRRPPSIPSSAG